MQHVHVHEHTFITFFLSLSFSQTNRQYLIQPHLNTLKILLSILNLALQHEQLESSGLGATVAQQVLSVTEPVLQETSIQQRVIVRSVSEEVSHVIIM